MTTFPSRIGTAPGAPTRAGHGHRKLLRWATVTFLLLAAAVAVSRA